MAIPQLTKPKYSAEQISALYGASKAKGQVTANGIVYFYLNGDSKQFRSVVLFREDGQQESALETAEQDVRNRDPDVLRVSFMGYQGSKTDANNAARTFTVYSGSLH